MSIALLAYCCVGRLKFKLCLITKIEEKGELLFWIYSKIKGLLFIKKSTLRNSLAHFCQSYTKFCQRYSNQSFRENLSFRTKSKFKIIDAQLLEIKGGPGGLVVVRKYKRPLFHVLLHFYDHTFWTLPPPPYPSPLLCASMSNIQPVSWQVNFKRPSIEQKN
jgi:hypothetical protein